MTPNSKTQGLMENAKVTAYVVKDGQIHSEVTGSPWEVFNCTLAIIKVLMSNVKRGKEHELAEIFKRKINSIADELVKERNGND